MPVALAARLELCALPGLPVVGPGADLADLVWRGLERAGIALGNGDVLVLASKMVSRAEDRHVDLGAVRPSAEAEELARRTGKDARLVELILGESSAVSRAARGVLITRHRLGFVAANAAIDQSNARPPYAGPGSGPWALLLPVDPDRAAAEIRARLEARAGATVGVIITDSHGRPFRHGSVGTALGVAGVPALNDLRGQRDLTERALEETVTALADQIAAAADLVAGQAGEGRGAVHVRGIVWDEACARLWGRQSAADLTRRPGEDLYA